MANPIGSVQNAQQAAQVSATEAHQKTPTPKQNAANNTGTPQDTVTISNAAKAASQASAPGQGQKAGGDADHDGK
jgi:hypothetical protein